MIQCDTCSSWQHTPCAGYYTNMDKRIPERYTCYGCKHRGNSKLLRNLQDLAAFRRAISVVYSEGLDSIQWLSRRLSTTKAIRRGGTGTDLTFGIACGVAKASKLVRRLESEGLVSRPNTQGPFLVHKTSQTKDKIRHFFTADLSVFPELAIYLGAAKKAGHNNGGSKAATKSGPATAPIIPAKRRQSMTAERVACM